LKNEFRICSISKKMSEGGKRGNTQGLRTSERGRGKPIRHEREKIETEEEK
jgi:hypothetical protein